MADTFHKTFFLAGPAGKLEATLWTAPETDGEFAALVCHPHPLFGGTMHNKVVFRAAKALQQRGMPVLRFNFRGVEKSSGEHGGGEGEQDDVRAALDYLAKEFPGRKIIMGGFSFGSWVALRVGCMDACVAELIGIGIPVNNVDMSYLRECAKPKLFVQGGNDQFGSRKNVEKLFATLPEPKRLTFIENADHFFTGQLELLGAAIDGWMDERRGPDKTAAR